MRNLLQIIASKMFMIILKTMKNYISKLTFSIIAVFLIACTVNSNQEDENPDIVTQKLNGEWTWVKSTGSIAGITVTPESSGLTMDIEFTTNHIFNKNVNGNTVYTSPFNIQEDEIEFTTIAQFPSAGFGLDHQSQQQIKFEGDKILFLIDRCCDNFSFEFVKKE